TWFMQALCFSGDGSLLVSATNDCRIAGWNVATGEKKFSFEVDHLIDSISLSHDDNVLLVSYASRTPALWSLKTKEYLLKGGDKGSPAALSPLDSTYADSVDGTIRLWDFKRNKQIRSFFLEEGISVWSLSFSPDGRWIAAMYSRGARALWEVAT